MKIHRKIIVQEPILFGFFYSFLFIFFFFSSIKKPIGSHENVTTLFNTIRV